MSDPPQLSGHTSTDSLTVCLNSGWRLCFHSPGWTPSASSSITEIIPAPRDALVEWCSLLVCGYGSVGLCTHTNLKSTVVGKLSCVYGNGNDMEKESRPLVDLAPDEAMCKLKLLTLKAPYPQISLMSCVFFLANASIKIKQPADDMSGVTFSRLHNCYSWMGSPSHLLLCFC